MHRKLLLVIRILGHADISEYFNAQTVTLLISGPRPLDLG